MSLVISGTYSTGITLGPGFFGFANPVYVTGTISATGRALYGPSIYSWTVHNYGSISGRNSGPTRHDGVGVWLNNSSDSLTNAAAGTISGQEVGVFIHYAGSIVNSGTIAGRFGIELASGGVLHNRGLILGGSADALEFISAGGKVTNSGTIAAGSFGIDFVKSPGIVDNKGGLIQSAALQAVHMEDRGDAVTNTGTLIGNTSDHRGAGVFIDSGIVDNKSGLIEGYTGVHLFEGTVTNSGTIVGTAVGVALPAGGTVINSGTIISGGSTAVGSALLASSPVTGASGISGGVRAAASIFWLAERSSLRG